MECNNCGWNNPIGATKCQKCNQPLEKPVTTATTEGLQNMCPECGYLISDNCQVCPNCDTRIGNITVAESKATVIIDLDEKKPVSFIQNNNPKATVVLNLNDDTKSNNEATPATQVSKPTQDAGQKINPKATVVLNLNDDTKSNNEATPATQAANEVEMLKKTVREILFTDENQKETDYKYQLECMDCADKNTIRITMKASEAIQLNKGDILLIAGLRYRVV